MRRRNIRRTLAGLTLSAALAFTAIAHAHKVNMFAYVEGDRIYIEGYFADGKKAAKADVTLLDKNDKPLTSAVTDNEGQLTLPVPPSTDGIRIILNAGMGHQAEYTIFAGELGGAGKNPSDAAGTLNPDDTTSAVTPDDSAREVAASNRAGGDVALQATVEHAVGQAIKPLMRTISEMREEKELGAIVGGIGYIFGILGVFFYLKARKQTGS